MFAPFLQCAELAFWTHVREPASAHDSELVTALLAGRFRNAAAPVPPPPRPTPPPLSLLQSSPRHLPLPLPPVSRVSHLFSSSFKSNAAFLRAISPRASVLAFRSARDAIARSLARRRAPRSASNASRFSLFFVRGGVGGGGWGWGWGWGGDVGLGAGGDSLLRGVVGVRAEGVEPFSNNASTTIHRRRKTRNSLQEVSALGA